MAAMQPAQPQDPHVGPWIRKYLAALQADPGLQPPQAGLLPVWLEQQIDPALERGQPTPPRVTIQNAVTRSPAMVLLGPSGSGKSTVLRQLVRELAQEAATNPQAPLPLYVPLTFFAGSIENTLAAQARMRGPSIATLALARPCFLIVDALNDLPPAEQVPVLSILRRALSDLGPHARWIIACRSEAWGLFDVFFGGSRFQVWRARPWSDQTILNAVQRQGTPAGERLLHLPGAMELARRPRWLGAFLQLREDRLPGPLLVKWIEATALEAARTHCLSDQCAESALDLLQELGSILTHQPAVNRVTITSVVADRAADAKLPVADLQALLEALALLHPAGDDEWVFRSPLLSDVCQAIELQRNISRNANGATINAGELTHEAKCPSRLALLYGMLASPQPILRSLISAGAWEATQQVLDANVAPDEALAVLEETGLIDKDVGAALGRTWAQSGSAEVAVALLEWTVRDGRDDPYLFGLLGHLHRQSGNLVESRTAFQEALRRDPANFDYQQALAQVCHELGESDTATATLEGLLTAHHARLAAAAFQLGSLQEEQRRFAEALEQYSHAAALCPRGAPDCGRYLLAKARVLRLLRRHEEASQILRSVEATTSDPIALADENAALLEATGNDQQALERLGQIESLGSATATTYLRMAELHRRRDEQAAAERAYRAAAELDPRCEAAYEGIVELASQTGELGTAISACKRLVDLQRQRADHWRRLGALQRQAGQYTESANSLKMALQIGPSSETQLELARTRWAQGDQPTALSHYRNAALLDPDGRMSAEAGWALHEAGDLAAAQAMLERAAGLRPADGRVLYDLGRCFEAQGATTRALEWYMQAAHVAPSATTFRATGRAARILGERAMARQMLARALRLDRKSGETSAEIGRLHLQEDRPDLAAAALRRAREAGVEDVEIQRDLAEALLRLNDAHGALAILEAVTIDDNDFQTKRSRAYELLGDPQSALAIARAAAARQPKNAALQRRVGALALQAGQPVEALSALEAARTLADKEPSTLVNLSRAMLLTGRAAAALRPVDEALSRLGASTADPVEAAAAHIQRGRVLVALEDWAEARRAFEQALALDDENSGIARVEQRAQAWAGLAEAYSRIAGPSAGLPYARHALELQRGKGEYVRLVGRLLLEAGDRMAAREVLAADGAADPATLRLRLHVEMADGQWIAAVPLAARCHASAPNDLQVTAEYGIVLLQAGQPKEALPLLETACGSPAATPEWWAALGRCYLAVGNHTAATHALNRSLEVRPGDAETHAALGSAYMAKGAPGAAVHALRQALELGGDRLSWRATLAEAYTAQGWFAEALSEWERARQLAPEDAAIRLAAAQARLDIGDAESAMLELEEMAAADPHNLSVWQLLARAALAAGSAGKAVHAAAVALGQEPNDVDLRVLLAEAALADGDAQRAYDALTPLVQAEEPHVRALLLVHQAAKQLNDPAAARSALEQAGRIAPGDPDVQLAIADHLQATGEGGRALKLLRALFTRLGESAPVAASVAQQALKGGDLQLAREAAERATTLSPQDTGYARLFGKICYVQGDTGTARKALQLAMKGRQDPETALLLGKLALERGEATEASRLLRIAHEHRPGDTEAAGWLALALRRPLEPVVEDERPEPQRGPALDAALVLLQQAEQVPIWRAELGWTLVMCGDYQQAISNLSSASRSPDLPPEQRPVVLRRIGVALLALGRAGDALTPLERAKELDPADAVVCSLLGQLAAQQGNLHGAIQHYSHAVALEPENGHHHLRLGLALLQSGEVEAALDHLGRATELEPARAIAWTGLSQGLLQAGHLDRAHSCAQRAVQLQPTDGYAWRQLAAVAEARKDFTSALDALERAIAHAPGAPAASPIAKDWLMHYAELAIANGETDRGRMALQSAADLDPNDADLLHQLAGLHAPGERISLLQRAVQLRPDQAAWRTELADLLAARGEHRPALDHLQHAIEAQPLVARHWLSLARAHLHAGDDLAAEETLLRAKKMIESDPDVYGLLGDILAAQERWADALQNYIEAAQLDDSADRHVACARCLQALGRLNEAHEVLDGALKLDPKHAAAATRLAEVLMENDPHDGWKRAIKFARIAAEAAPGEIAGYKLQARAALEGKWFDEVKAALEHAAALAPEDPELHELHGWYYFHIGELELALDAAQRAIAHDPRSATAYYLQASIFRRQRRFDEAVASLRTAVHINRNFREALKELASLGFEALIHGNRK